MAKNINLETRTYDGWDFEKGSMELDERAIKIFQKIPPVKKRKLYGFLPSLKPVISTWRFNEDNEFHRYIRENNPLFRTVKDGDNVPEAVKFVKRVKDHTLYKSKNSKEKRLFKQERYELPDNIILAITEDFCGIINGLQLLGDKERLRYWFNDHLFVPNVPSRGYFYVDNDASVLTRKNMLFETRENSSPYSPFAFPLPTTRDEEDVPLRKRIGKMRLQDVFFSYAANLNESRKDLK